MGMDLRELAEALAELRLGAAELEAEATRLQKLADDRYADSAVLYGGGSSTFVRSIDTADEYAREAKALRAEAASAWALVAETEKLNPAVVGMKVR